jgi:hypothetical protein
MKPELERFSCNVWTKTVQQLDNGDLAVDISEACEQLGWQAGDVLEWINNHDGTWTIKKYTETAT